MSERTDAMDAAIQEAIQIDLLMGHNWSGWPGAFCLNCGIPDPLEECIAVCEDTKKYCDIHVLEFCKAPYTKDDFQ